jgi:prolyl-tRNA editing enzyme YbaK/EbsC (Cys-tRNA(Pro) deacylase)
MTGSCLTRQFLAEVKPDASVRDLGYSSPSIGEAAQALGVSPAQIAKALLVDASGQMLLVLMSGDARLDNQKFRAQFGARPRLVGASKTVAVTGQPLGGVGPFGLRIELAIYCDRSLSRFGLVYPAAGTRSRVVELTPEDLVELASAEWVDVCR